MWLPRAIPTELDFVLAQRSHGLHAIQMRHVHVEEDDVEVLLAHRLQCSVTACRAHSLAAEMGMSGQADLLPTPEERALQYPSAPVIRSYSHPSRIGTFRIALAADGRWHVWCDDDNLGSYPSPDSALDDLVGGHTIWPAGGDPSELGLSDDLSSWRASPVA